MLDREADSPTRGHLHLLGVHGLVALVGEVLWSREISGTFALSLCFCPVTAQTARGFPTVYDLPSSAFDKDQPDSARPRQGSKTGGRRTCRVPCRSTPRSRATCSCSSGSAEERLKPTGCLLEGAGCCASARMRRKRKGLQCLGGREECCRRCLG